MFLPLLRRSSFARPLNHAKIPVCSLYNHISPQFLQLGLERPKAASIKDIFIGLWCASLLDFNRVILHSAIFQERQFYFTTLKNIIWGRLSQKTSHSADKTFLVVNIRKEVGQVYSKQPSSDLVNKLVRRLKTERVRALVRFYSWGNILLPTLTVCCW